MLCSGVEKRREMIEMIESVAMSMMMNEETVVPKSRHVCEIINVKYKVELATSIKIAISK